ncbi:MAG: hypothetical protein RLY70_2458 [Planctomycetota bacterium]
MALKRRGDSAIFPALRRVFSRACGVLIDGGRAGTERYSTGDSQPHGYGSLSRRTADEARKTARATYRGVAQPGLARLLGVQEVVGSNPATPTETEVFEVKRLATIFVAAVFSLEDAW